MFRKAKGSNGLYVTVVFTLSVSATAAHGMWLTKYEKLTPGDPVKKVERFWGKPTYQGRSDRTCDKLPGETQLRCSTQRRVWLRGDKYYLIQVQGSKVIKRHWTRFERRIWDEF